MEPVFYPMHMLGYGNFSEVKEMSGRFCLNDLKRGQKGMGIAAACITVEEEVWD